MCGHAMLLARLPLLFDAKVPAQCIKAPDPPN
jgi:hypothetical protein